jgi:outer membrane biogenesis lipoprotein LolB
MNNRQKSCFFLLAASLIMLAACSSSAPAPASMAGFWADPDNNVTTIQSQDGQYKSVTTYYLVASYSQNSLVSSSWENGVLTWKYCPPAKACLTMKTVSFNGDSLEVSWTNADGESGKMTLKRVEKGTN